MPKWIINKVNSTNVTFKNSNTDESLCIKEIQITSDILTTRKKTFCIRAWVSDTIEDSVIEKLRHEFEFHGFRQHLANAMTSRTLQADDYDSIVQFLLILKAYEPIAKSEFHSMLEVFSIWPSDLSEINCAKPRGPLQTVAKDFKMPEDSLPKAVIRKTSKLAFFDIPEESPDICDSSTACNNTY